MGETYSAVGKTGEYFVAKDGFHPQAGDAFVYSDKKYHFWFYVEFVPRQEQQTYRLLINAASSDRFSGGNPRIDVQDLTVVAENIRHYFGAFDLSGCEITPSNPAPVVVFTWTLDSDND